MHKLILLASLIFHHTPTPQPYWLIQDDSGIPTPTCGIGWTPYASEHELVAGKPFVHCVRESKHDHTIEKEQHQ